jgi:hypothetical protein
MTKFSLKHLVFFNTRDALAFCDIQYLRICDVSSGRTQALGKCFSTFFSRRQSQFRNLKEALPQT